MARMLRNRTKQMLLVIAIKIMDSKAWCGRCATEKQTKCCCSAWVIDGNCSAFQTMSTSTIFEGIETELGVSELYKSFVDK